MDRALWKVQMVSAEGNRLRLYTDSLGNISGGIGRNLAGNGFRQSEVDLMFENDSDDVETDLQTNFSWWVPLDDVRQRAFAEMRFNLGPARFREFHRALTAASIGDWDTASAQILASQADIELPARYARIAQMVKTGVDQTG